MFADARIEAQTDSLTGLGNRRKLMTDLRRELQRRERRARRACWCCSTSTASSATTTPTATRPATSLLTRLGANLGRAIKPYGERLPARRRRVLRARR